MNANHERLNLVEEIKLYDKELRSFNFEMLEMDELRRLHSIVRSYL